MNRQTSITPVFVEFMPDQLEQGKLYISRKFLVAIHLCCCGCGLKTVTPIDDTYGWKLVEADGKVSLSPSIGNFQFPCHSHYFITENSVNWC